VKVTLHRWKPKWGESKRFKFRPYKIRLHASFTDEKFRWMETHRCILPLCVQLMFIIKRFYKMGTIMFKSGTGKFLRIYNTYNVCQKKKVNGF